MNLFAVVLTLTLLGAAFADTDSNDDDISRDSRYSGSLRYYYRPNRGELIYNDQVATVLYIDYNYEYFAWYNGQKGYVIIYDRIGRTFTYVNVENLVWISANRNFGNYFGRVYSLREYYKKIQRVSVVYTYDTWTRDFEESFTAVVSSFSVDYSASCKNYGYTLDFVNSYYDHRIHNHDKLYTHNKAVLAGDIRWYYKTYAGWSWFYSRFHGGSVALVKKNIKFDYGTLTSYGDGWGSFTYFVKVLFEKKYDSLKELSDDLSSEIKIWNLYDRLSGQITYGFGGFTGCIHVILRYTNDEISRGTLHVTLLKYFTQKRAVKDNDYGGQLVRYARDTRRWLENYRLSKTWGLYYALMVAIQENRWVYQNVEMFKVFDFFYKASWSEDDVNQIINYVDQRRENRGDRSDDRS